MYIKRWVEEKINALFEVFPVVVLTGPRQVGKTTTAQTIASGGAFVNFDDIYTLYNAKLDPKSVIPDADVVVIDEVQRFPDVLLVVKEIVDADPSRRFLLTGSSALLVMKDVTETLSGRAAYVSMGPFAIGEIQGRGMNLEKLIEGKIPEPEEFKIPFRDLVSKGLFPRAFFLKSGWDEWYRMYLSTYVEKEFRQLSGVVELSSFASFLVMVFQSISSIFNESEVAKEIGISQPTVHRYLSAVEALQIIHRVRPLGKKATSVKKRFKVYAADPSIPLHALHAKLTEEFEGKLLENLIFNQLRYQASLLGMEIHYYRTKSSEVDFVVSRGEKRAIFEVKRAGADLRTVKNVVRAKEEIGADVAYIVKISGEVREVLQGVWEIPYWMV